MYTVYGRIQSIQMYIIHGEFKIFVHPCVLFARLSQSETIHLVVPPVAQRRNKPNQAVEEERHEEHKSLKVLTG